MSQQRAHVIIPTVVLHQIDSVVGQRKRSQFLTAAAEKELMRLKQLAALKKYAGSWAKKSHPELEKKGGSARFVRQLRRESDRRL